MNQSEQGEDRTGRRIRIWLLSMGAFLAIAFLLGRQPFIGVHAARAAACHLALLGLLWPLIQTFPFHRQAWWLIPALALVARLLFLPMSVSDDVHRYVWEGTVLSEGFNPYLHPPAGEELEPLRTPEWEQINHPEMTAIYPPGCLLLFKVLSGLRPDPALYRAFFIGADLLTVCLLLACLGRMHRRPEWAFLYALNPLTLLSFAGEGHLDALLVLFLVLSGYAILARKPLLTFVAFAAAFHVKYVSILLLPFVVRRENLRFLVFFPFLLVLPFLPFYPGTGLFDSLRTFSASMHYNDGLHHLLGNIMGSFPAASRLCLLLLLLSLAVARAATPRYVEGGALVMSALLLLSPNVHIWYLTWVLPFLCFCPLRPMLVWCATITLSYFTLHHLHYQGEWKEFEWVLWAEYIPVYGALAVALLRPRARGLVADAIQRPLVSRPSIVVPVLNEHAAVEAFMDSVQQIHGCTPEIVVSDGGSSDGTPDAARRRGAIVVDSPPGRGHQVAAGIRKSTGDYILVAHADMRFASDLLWRIEHVLNETGRLGGCVGCRFDDQHLFMRVISLFNHLRVRLTGISFGDQGQFIRRDALEEIGGFPDLPLMEDVELAYRLREREHPLYLGGGIRVSARRWRQEKKWRHAVLVVRLVAAYQIRRWLHGPNAGTADLYRRYYPR